MDFATPKISTFIRALPLSFMIAVWFAAPARAQNYPNGPIHIIVPYAAGGLTDLANRVCYLPARDGRQCCKPWRADPLPHRGGQPVIQSAIVRKFTLRSGKELHCGHPAGLDQQPAGGECQSAV